MSTKNHIPEHMRWYVVGAHLAGAVDSQIMEMTDLTRGSIRQIITNFKRTGSPSIARLAPPDDPNYAMIAEAHDNNNNNNTAHTSVNTTTIDTNEKNTDDDQDHKSKRRRGASKKYYTATHVVQRILDESQKPKMKRTKPSLQSQSSSKSTKKSSSLSSKSTEWTRQDDLILLQHAWTRFPRACGGSRWVEAESKLNGRHSAKECKDRWEVLQPVIIKAIDRYGTEGW